MATFSSQTSHPPFLIIGLGNPILGDDGVGWAVAKQVQTVLDNQSKKETLPAYDVDCLSVGGLSLMERMIGYDFVIIIDAMLTSSTSQGKVVSLNLSEIPNQAWGHLTSSHDTTLQNALEIGRKMGARLPCTIWVVGIEAQYVYDFSETLTPAVAAAVPEAVQRVIQLLPCLER
jgi:hydrogenase maturation protease